MATKVTKPAAKKIRRYRFQYAAKFLCTANIPGTSQTSGSVLPGAYQTAVNIHNPGRERAKYRMKIALPGQISNFRDGALAADAVANVDCNQITSDFGITFIHGAEGFLVIESSHSLDVTAVYTAGAVGGQVTGIDVEEIKERQLQ